MRLDDTVPATVNVEVTITFVAVALSVVTPPLTVKILVEGLKEKLAPA